VRTIKSFFYAVFNFYLINTKRVIVLDHILKKFLISTNKVKYEDVLRLCLDSNKVKLLQPSGSITINAFGLDEDGQVDTLASDTYTQTASFTGWGQLLWSDGELPSLWSGDVGVIDFTSMQIAVVLLEIDETLNQLGWEVTSDTSGVDYLLSTVNTRGIEVPRSYFGD